MKTKFFFGAALTVLLALAVANPVHAATRINPDKLDLGLDVSGFDMGTIKLYQGAVQARHCHFFMDAMLRAEYKEYQYKKCGDELYYDVPKGPFDPSTLSGAEADFMARLKKREARLKSRQARVIDGVTQYNPNALVNRAQFPHMKEAALNRLVNTGFVVTPGNHHQLFHVYEENDYRMVPSFITADSVLQLYHLYFDFSLRQIEEEKLLPAAAGLSRDMAKALKARYDREDDPKLKLALRKAALYFAVAEDLATMAPVVKPEVRREVPNVIPAPPALVSDADFKRPPPAWLPGAWKKDFLAQRELILKAKGVKRGPIMATVDYTMFKPRGHYTRTKKLMAYFRTMMWLGLPGFILDEKHTPMETTLAVVYELTHDDDLMNAYDLIYEPTSFYVGPTDDITPDLVRKVADEICGQKATLNSWIASKEEIRLELIRRDPTRIKTKFLDDRGKPQVRFMGMRYTPDADMLQKLIDVDLRPFPAGLDVFGVMGVPAALEILKAAKTKWPEYWPTMEKLQGEFADFKPRSGEPNLYWRWMGLLKTLNQPAPKGAAPFMTTKPWEYKNLNTALASWTELRHDTILYAKPSGAECGGEETPPKAIGYVEARPDFFKELLELQRYTTSELKKRDLLTDRLAGVAERMENTFSFLERVARKEVEGQPLTREEYEDIRIFGSNLEYMTVAVLLDDEYATWTEVTGPDKMVAVVADIYTYMDKCLEEAVGYADEIYVVVEVEGYLYIMRGAVFSYYEFTQKSSNRLTDEQWQKMLKDGKAPPRPGWVKEFMEHQPVGKPVDPYLYSSGC